MKSEDFERLKKLCQENDFEIDGYHPSSRIFIIDKKDPWEGVEFVECVNNPCSESWTIGKVYKLSGKVGLTLQLKDDQLSDANVIEYCSVKFPYHNCFKPSTEQAYIEQLKKEAFERFGEIKDGDRFKEPIKASYWVVNAHDSKSVFKYLKDEDAFMIGGLIVYKRGKWASRVKERVEVSLSEMSSFVGQKLTRVIFDISGESLQPEKAHILASQLEAYLNR